jgi:hypothetical protein
MSTWQEEEERPSLLLRFHLFYWNSGDDGASFKYTRSRGAGAPCTHICVCVCVSTLETHHSVEQQGTNTHTQVLLLTS